MKRIICLWGGPGTGKSTACAGLFHKIKNLGYVAEMNREYVKDWVWENRKILPGDQIYITAKQARREIIYMREGIDFIITDSPLALTTFYGNLYDPFEKLGQASKAMVKQHWEICKSLGYKVDHFFLTRTKPYCEKGRHQDEATAKEYDQQIKIFLDEYPIKYKTIICDDNVEQSILDSLGIKYHDKMVEESLGTPAHS